MEKIKQGQIVKMMLEPAGYTVTSFAQRLGIDRKTLQRRFSEDPMDPEFVATASKALGIDLSNVAVGETKSAENERLKKELAAALAREQELKAQVYDLLKAKGIEIK